MRHLPVVLCLSLSAAVAGCDAASRSALAASSDAATATPGPVAGAVGTLAIEAATVPAGPSFNVTVTDADQNLDPESRDAVTVHARKIAPTVTEFESFILRETGANTGVFEGSVAVGPEKAANTVQVANGDTVLVEYRDRNTTSSGACSWQAVPQTAVVDAVRADLRFESVSMASSVVAGSTVHVEATVSNHTAPGAATAGSSWVRAEVGRWHLNREYGWEFIAIKLLGTKAIDALAPGDSRTVFFDYTPDLAQANVVVRLYADAAYVVPELNEDNNVADRPLAVVGPDLDVVDDVTVTPSPPTPVLAGGTVEVRGEVVNLPGGSAAPGTTVGGVLGFWYEDYDGRWWKDVSSCSSQPVPSLGDATGNRFEFHISCEVPLGLDGPLVVKVTADAGRAVDERDEMNNDAYADLVIQGSDLYPCGDPTITPSPDLGAQALTVSGTVCNAPGPAAPGSTVSVLFGRMESDYPGEYFAVISRTNAAVAGVAGGGSQPYQVPVSFTPPLPSGAYVVQVLVDGGGVVGEPNEANNATALVPVTLK